MSRTFSVRHTGSAAAALLGDRVGERTGTLLTRSLDPRNWSRLRVVSDTVVIYLACGAAAFGDASIRSQPDTAWLALIFPLVVLGMLYLRRTPDGRLNGSLLDTVAHVLGIVSLATMLLIGAASILGDHPLRLALRLWLFSVVYLAIARAVLLSVRRHAMRTGLYAIPTLIVGAGTVGTHLVRRLADDLSYGLRPVGFLDSSPLSAGRLHSGPSLPVLGGPDDLSQAIAQTGARHVILAFSSEPDQLLVSKVRECEALGVKVSLVPRLYESINERTMLDHVGGLPLLTLQSVDPRGWQFAVKHALDRIVAGLALTVAAPIMLALAVAVKLSSPGPILFRQQRIGRDGHEFTMLKFRTMRGSPASAGEADAGWAAQILDGVPGVPGVAELTASLNAPPNRTTSVGRFMRTYSLDELPQLLNVLRGDMSLVGPRPERVAYVRDFEIRVERYADRHRVKSGLTGWAQVNGLRGQTSIADRVEWDNYYIQNWSLKLDLKIVALTLVEVLQLGERRAPDRVR